MVSLKQPLYTPMILLLLPLCLVTAAPGLAADGPAVQAICYYGQMVGAEIEKPPGHYEETNSADWDLADDLWDATVRLFEQPWTRRFKEFTAMPRLYPGWPQ